MNNVEFDFVVSDALAAFETYQKVFNAETIQKTSLERGSNEVIFTIFGTRFHILDENPDYYLIAPKEDHINTSWFNLTVENIQEVFDKAEAAGFTTIQPITEIKELGLKNSIQKDPWGYIWMLHTQCA